MPASSSGSSAGGDVGNFIFYSFFIHPITKFLVTYPSQRHIKRQQQGAFKSNTYAQLLHKKKFARWAGGALAVLWLLLVTAATLQYEALV